MQVTLEGQLIWLPAEHRPRSAIRCSFETLALERQRILFMFTMDGEPANTAWPTRKTVPFTAR